MITGLALGMPTNHPRALRGATDNMASQFHGEGALARVAPAHPTGCRYHVFAPGGDGSFRWCMFSSHSTPQFN